MLDLLVEGEPHVLPGVDARCGVERGVPVELVHHLTEGHAVLRAEIDAKALVEFGNDARERLQLLRRSTVGYFGAHGLQYAGLPFQRDFAADVATRSVSHQPDNRTP